MIKYSRVVSFFKIRLGKMRRQRSRRKQWHALPMAGLIFSDVDDNVKEDGLWFNSCPIKPSFQKPKYVSSLADANRRCPTLLLNNLCNTSINPWQKVYTKIYTFINHNLLIKNKTDIEVRRFLLLSMCHSPHIITFCLCFPTNTVNFNFKLKELTHLLLEAIFFLVNYIHCWLYIKKLLMWLTIESPKYKCVRLSRKYF